MSPHDLIIAGGGLVGGLIAWRLAQVKPELRVLLLERESRIGGDRTWSFHGTDLSAESMQWLAPLVSGNWPMQEVRFPSYNRQLSTSYHSIRSTDLDRAVRLTARPGSIVQGDIRSLSDREAVLGDGRVFSASVVIDARGAVASEYAGCGFQKFVGLDVELEVPHGLTCPLLMDVCVPQEDGFRFFYLLPWSDRTLLIEDTHYSASPELDLLGAEVKIRSYAETRGWSIRTVHRMESGILPIPLRRPSRAPVGTVPRVGMRAGHFHYVTGYSLPYAVATTEAIAALPDGFSAAHVTDALERVSRAGNPNYSVLLNRMLFGAAEPGQRYRIFERFYRLDQGLIERFYRGALRPSDQLRILAGRPPVSIGRAVKSLFKEEASCIS